jgi:hypothetical protein
MYSYNNPYQQFVDIDFRSAHPARVEAAESALRSLDEKSKWVIVVYRNVRSLTFLPRFYLPSIGKACAMSTRGLKNRLTTNGEALRRWCTPSTISDACIVLNILCHILYSGIPIWWTAGHVCKMSSTALLRICAVCGWNYRTLPKMMVLSS